MACSRQPYNGFTIVELLVVIVTIGILAAITIVSYIGITAKANIATMQSDLASASQKLNLYQVADPSNNYPADQAAAIAANVIKPNTNMDYIYYGVDNTSNPKYYCYMYRKGTDTWAVDSNSAVSKGVCLQNLVTNGDFSQGATGWMSSAPLTVSNNECYFTVISQHDGPAQYIPNYVNYKSHKLYYAASVKVNSNPVYLILNDALSQSTITSASFESYARLSGVWTINPGTTGIYAKLQDSRSTGWSTNYIKYWATVDITSAFGAGNEPTQAQMDALMAQLPNNWFNITAKVNL